MRHPVPLLPCQGAAGMFQTHRLRRFVMPAQDPPSGRECPVIPGPNGSATSPTSAGARPVPRQVAARLRRAARRRRRRPPELHGLRAPASDRDVEHHPGLAGPVVEQGPERLEARRHLILRTRPESGCAVFARRSPRGLTFGRRVRHESAAVSSGHGGSSDPRPARRVRQTSSGSPVLAGDRCGAAGSGAVRGRALVDSGLGVATQR